MNVWLARFLFSLNSFAASILALFIALRMGLVNPYWAATTVYIVSLPQAGSVRSKALYRLLGTLIGASAAVLLVPALDDAPELLSLALALWVGMCLGVSLLDRTPRAYALMLSGYTAALIAFPAVNAPQAVFSIAVARVEEISLGVVCATLVHSIVLPQGVARSVAQRTTEFMGGARAWALDALAGRPDPRSADAHRLATAITDLHLMATHLPFDTSHVQDRRRELGKLAERMAVLLPLAASVGDRIAVLNAQETPLPAETAGLIGDIAAWIAASAGAPLAEAPLLAERAQTLAAAQEAAMATPPDFALLVSANLLVRLGQLVEAWRDCLALSRHIARGEALPAELQPLLAEAHAHALHRDLGMAAWSGAAAVLAILVVCTGWIMTGWADGGTAAMMTAVFMCFYASMDDPAKGIDVFAACTALSIPITAVYLFAVMPLLHSFAMLALALAPFLLVCGALMAIPAWTGRALPVVMGTAGSLGIQESFAPDFAAFANASLATLAGVAAASLVTRLVRSVGADFSARRLMRLIRADLARQAAERSPMPLARWTGLMVDRVGLIGARLAGSGDPEGWVGRALGDMRVGMNLIALAPLQSNPGAGEAIERLQYRLRRHFRGASENRAERAALLAEIDGAITALCAASPAADRREGLLALTGLRRALFPAALTMAAPA